MRKLTHILTIFALVFGINARPMSAQTDCGNVNVPYTQDFESVADYTLPDCWAQINPFEGGYPAAAPTSPHGGTNTLMFRTFDTPQFAVMPHFMADFNSLQLTFWTRRSSASSGSLSVGYLTDTSDVASFVSLWSSTAAQMGNNSYQFVTVNFANVTVDPALDYRIAFRYEAANAFNFWYVDDIAVEATSSCVAPYDLASTAVTSNGATLSWSGNADSYMLYYKRTNDTVWEMVPFITTTSYPIEGLIPATAYQWYVAADCGDTLLPSATTATFTTECGVYPLPFAQNFNASNNLPLCWNRLTGSASSAFAGTNPTATTSGWNFYTASVFGQYHPRLNIYGSSMTRWIVTPPIDLATAEVPGLTFKLAYTRNNSSSAVSPGNQPNHRFMVLVSTDNGASWSAANATVWSNDGLGDFILDSVPSTGQSYTIPLSQYVGDTILIAFYGESLGGGGDNDLHIDDVEVGELSSCSKPIQLDAFNMTNTSVTLDWTETGDATSWNVLYGPSGTLPSSADATTMTADSHPYTVTDLTAGTSYDFYVQADCGDAQSAWVGPVTMRPGFLNMRTSGHDTLTSCEAMVYDNGGPDGNYSSSCNSTLVIYPETVGASISVQGQVSTEQGYDSLFVYDGAGADGPLLGVFTGLNQTVPTLVSSTGPMTLRFKSDMVTEYAGFALEVNCVTCFPPSGLAVSGITDNMAVLSWDNNEYVSSWLVEYRADGDTVWEQATTSNPTYTLTGLDEGTYYDVRVSTDCNNEYSMPSTLTFATVLNAAPLPYSTGFGENEDRLWKRNNGTCANRWVVGGSEALFITADGSTPGYTTDGAVSNVTTEKRFLVGAGETFNLSFDVRVGGEANYDYLKVFFAPDSMEFPASNNFPAYAIASHDTFALNLSAYTTSAVSPYILMLTQGNTVHVETTLPNPYANPADTSVAKLVFAWRNDNSDGTQPGAVIDNISIDVTACPQPSNFTVSNVTSDNASLVWASSASVSAWNIEYREAGTENWFTATASDTAYTLTGLAAGSPYEVRVQSDCGSSQSLWAFATFTTDCETVTALPYSQGFETMNQMPECWRQEYVAGSVSWTTHYGDGTSFSTAHSGNLNAYLYQESYDTAVTRLVTPVFDLSGTTNPYVSFWVLQQAWGNDQDMLTVYYRTAADAPWQLLVEHNNSVEEWLQDSIALPVTSSYCQFAFEGRVNYGYGIALDDFTVGDAVPVVVVTDPTVTTNPATAVSQTSATISGTITNPDNVTITERGFVLTTVSTGNWSEFTVAGTGNTFSSDLTNLTPATDYTFKAFITFNGTTVYGDELSFTTLPEEIEPCETPTSLTATNVENNTATITWDANPNVSSWNIRYRKADEGSWNTVAATTNSYTFSNLTPSTTYNVQVQAVCDNGNQSEWSATCTFTTVACIGIESWLENSVKVFPNPANDFVNVQCTMYNVQFGADLHLFDVYGKLVQTVPMTGETTSVNVTNLADGMYFVRVTTEAGMVTKPFVVKR